MKPISNMVKECFMIIAGSALCALMVNAVSPRGIALVGEWDTSKGVVSAVRKDAPVVHELEIGNIQVVKQLFEAQETVFVDARPAEAFAGGHIKGAVSMPVHFFGDTIEDFIETYPLSTHIVTYCSGRECADGHDLAQMFLNLGYENVQVFIDGYPAWEQNGFPVEASEKVA